MECRKLDITLLSAKNLPNKRKYGKMKVYAEVSINGNSKTAKKTTVDEQNECNPVWKSTVTYTLSENFIVQKAAGVDIVIKLFCKRTMGNRYIGEVKLAMSSLLGKGTSHQNIDHPVSGTAEGILSISCNFGEKILVQKPPSGWDVQITKIMLSVGLTILIKGTLILITAGLYDGGDGFEFDFTGPSDDIVDDSFDGVPVTVDEV